MKIKASDLQGSGPKACEANRIRTPSFLVQLIQQQLIKLKRLLDPSRDLSSS